MFRTLVSSLSALAVSSFALMVLAPALCSQSRPSSETVVASRIVQPVDDNARITLHGYVHPQANALNDRGPAPDSMPLTRMHLVLQRSAGQESALRQFIADAHTPGSPNYHKWLTTAEFGQRFGPSDQDVATVESWLASQGFAVNRVLPGRQVIEFSGNVAQMRTAFAVHVHQYVVNGSPHFATATEPQVPAALAPVVSGFVSLNNFRPKSYARVLGKALYDPKTGKTTPTWTVSGGAGYPTIGGVNFALSPADFATQYDLNPLYTAGVDGSGQTIAIVNESNINITLVNQFRSLFGLPANPPNVIIDGNDPGIDGINNPDGPNYASPEAYLDVEWAGAVAPKATVDLVIAADTSLESGLILAAEHAVYGNVAPVMSMSFGSCEASLGSSNAFINQVLMEQAAAQGITVMVSTGDSGSAGCDNPAQYYAVSGLGVNGFASTPWNVAVGGTDFYYGSNYANLSLTDLGTYWNTTGTNTPPAGGSLLAPIAEQPWNSSQFGLDASDYYSNYGSTTIAGASGGASSAAVCPAGYSSTGACNGTPTGYPKPAWQTGTGTQSDSVRDIPDVSLFAADGPNYSYYPICYEDGDCQTGGSGPVQIFGVGGTSAAAPAFAGIMALVNQKYGRQGQADFVLYPLKTQFPAAFHDITVGTIAVPCNLTAVSGHQPVNCITPNPNPITTPITDPTYGSATEGETGVGTTPSYNAAAGYNLATGLGSVDAAVLVNDWGSVTFAASNVTLTPSSTSFTHGTAITVSGSVSGSGTPGGTVALMTDSTLPLMAGTGNFPLSSGSFSASNVNYLPGGTYNIWGQYSGDGTNAPGKSTPVQITVNAEASTTIMNLQNATGGNALSAGASNVPYGTQVLVNAAVYGSTFYTQCSGSSSSANCQAYTSPTGTITFADNGTTINTGALNAEGDAEFNAPFFVGSHSVTASYAGDASYQKSSASAVSFTIVKNTPTVYVGTTFTTSSGSFIGGQDTVLTVELLNSANIGSSGSTATGGAMPVSVTPPTGSISFSGFPSGVPTSATLQAGVDPSTGAPVGIGTIVIPAKTSAATYNITINYSGDSNYASTSASGSIPIQSVGGTPSSITAKMSGSISATTTVTISGTVTGSSGGAAPGNANGGVLVYSSGYSLGNVPVTPGSGNTSTFTAVVKSQNLLQGSNSITVQYLGDGTYAPSSFTLTTPIANPLSDFTLTAAPMAPVARGSSGPATLYVSPANGFSGSVALSVPADCGLGSNFTCSLDKTTVTLTSSATASLERDRRLPLFLGGGGAALACVLLLTIPARRRAWRNLLALLLFACIAGFGVGCGGGSNAGNLGGGLGGGGGGGGGGGTTTTPGNPSVAVTLTVTAASGATPGTYNVTVTGTAGSQVHTAGVTAVVQ